MMYWALLKYHFGITNNDFWSLSPTQLNTLIDRYNKEEETKNKRTALICAVLANCHRDPKRKAFTVDDFMPTQKKVTKKQTPEQQLEIIRLWNAALRGKK